MYRDFLKEMFVFTKDLFLITHIGRTDSAHTEHCWILDMDSDSFVGCKYCYIKLNSEPRTILGIYMFKSDSYSHGKIHSNL